MDILIGELSGSFIKLNALLESLRKIKSLLSNRQIHEKYVMISLNIAC